MKKLVTFSLKCAISVVLALAILSGFSLFYYNSPIATVQPDGITNSKMPPNKKWSYALEGYGYGTTDALGYNNAYYRNCTDPDVTFIGSSHLEALQVPEDKNFVYLLNQNLDTDDSDANNLKCLNLGISGHFLNISLSNFKYVADKFPDSKYIVIETSNVELSPSKLDKIMEGKYHDPMKQKSGIYAISQKIPYLRLLYKKIQEVSPKKKDKDDSGESDLLIYREKMNIILKNISNISQERGIETIVLLHGTFDIDYTGVVISDDDDFIAYRNIFKECCADNGIKVIDVRPSLISNYEETAQLPYGFANAEAGEGHLNKHGHKLIADELYTKFNEMVEVK